MGISVDGLVSGLDTTSIVQQLIDLESRPIVLKQNKQDDLATQKLAWQEINTKLLGLETAAGKLNTTGKFASRSATFANNDPTTGSVLSVTAGSSAVVGAFDVAVTQLAAAQKSALDQTYSSISTGVGASGTLTLNDGTDHTIALTSGMTLEQIKNAINDSGAALNATIINSGTSATPAYQIIMTGDDTGADNSFTHSASLDAGTLSFTDKVTAKNALLTVDGVSITKASNTVTDVIDGATLNLQTLGSGTINMAADVDGIVENIKGFVDAYNEVNALVKTHNTYNPDQNTRGTLFGNATLNTISDQIRRIMTTAVSGADVTDVDTLSSLAQIGIKNDNENVLSVDETKLRDALKDNFTQTQNLFVPSGTGTYTMVTADRNTTGGTYDTQVVDTGGGTYRLQMKLTGTSTWTTLDQGGSFASGPAGSSLEGLLLRTGELTAGDVGTTGSMTVKVGAAQLMKDATASFTEYSSEGLVFNQYKSIESRDKELQIQIADLQERLGKKQEDLKLKFANLEVLLSKLNSQQEYLTGALASLSK